MLDFSFKMIHIADRVNHRPVFTTSLQNETVVLGSNVTFVVKILSDLHINVQWIWQRCHNSSECPKQNLEVMEMENIRWDAINKLIEL